jgi:hypothetical protein
MARELRFTLAAGFFSLLLLGNGGAWAQSDAIERIDAIYLQSEQDNAGALEALQSLGKTFNTTTPYSVQREYLTRIITLEIDSANAEAARASIVRMLQQAQSEHDDLGVALAMSFDASAMVDAAPLGGSHCKTGRSFAVCRAICRPHRLVATLPGVGLCPIGLGQIRAGAGQLP